MVLCGFNQVELNENKEKNIYCSHLYELNWSPAELLFHPNCLLDRPSAKQTFSLSPFLLNSVAAPQEVQEEAPGSVNVQRFTFIKQLMCLAINKGKTILSQRGKIYPSPWDMILDLSAYTQ